MGFGYPHGGCRTEASVRLIFRLGPSQLRRYPSPQPARPVSNWPLGWWQCRDLLGGLCGSFRNQVPGQHGPRGGFGT